MSNAPSIESLLEKWDELRDAGQEVSVDSLCLDAPELLPELRIQIEHLKAMDWLDNPDADSFDPLDQPRETARFETAMPAPRVPAVLADRYEMQSLMAEGGFGQVWRAMDRSLLRPVAVKVTTINCYAEARRVAQLKHHGIVTVHDVGNVDGLCFIVFDLIDGSTLEDQIRQGQLTSQQSAKIVADVAVSLQFAHDKGFIHRDIKPTNILLDNDGSPVLADFGIAVTECELQHEAMTSVGTLAYMAPEQLQVGGIIDVRTDVYGLGVVFYELLTRRLPFIRSTLSGLRELILAGDPVAPRSINASIPEAYERICLKCLLTKKDDRFPTARALAEALRLF